MSEALESLPPEIQTRIDALAAELHTFLYNQANQQLPEAYAIKDPNELLLRQLAKECPNVPPEARVAATRVVQAALWNPAKLAAKLIVLAQAGAPSILEEEIKRHRQSVANNQGAPV